ncbi:MAG: ATPase, T2SS/T4P/T4SS family, partial [Gammaproteobacteria bacterium]|nr:ATPase, T2SS/T4P/T4SS family [Gammaproteobacteria bacterium]
DGIKKIITVEDPVEYQMPSITQIQVHAEIGYTFARALRHILRQDPDVIMIGEIRDLETAEIAIRSALTGHVVLSTLHTNDAVSSFTRLIDMGVERFLVASPTSGVQAQRLVRRVCEHCAEPADQPALAMELLHPATEGLLGSEWVRATGCDACQNTGYRGRMGIYELVPITNELQEMIVSGANLIDLKRFAHDEQGHRTLLQDGLLKASKGETTVEEVLRQTLTSVEDDHQASLT